jgi:hypothetical protein
MDISNYTNNEYLLAVLAIFLSVYGSMSRVTLPKWLVKLFKNDIFRVGYISLLLIVPFDTLPHVAIILALIFVVTLNFINKQESKEQFELFETLAIMD